MRWTWPVRQRDAAPICRARDQGLSKPAPEPSLWPARGEGAHGWAGLHAAGGVGPCAHQCPRSFEQEPSPPTPGLLPVHLQRGRQLLVLSERERHPTRGHLGSMGSILLCDMPVSRGTLRTQDTLCPRAMSARIPGADSHSLSPALWGYPQSDSELPGQPEGMIPGQ